MKPDFKKQIDTIMAEFNWNKVQRAMIALDWQWLSAGDKKVPSVNLVKRTARQLLLDLASINKNKKEWDFYSSISTGGLLASIDHGMLKLSFEVDSIDYCNFDRIDASTEKCKVADLTAGGWETIFLGDLQECINLENSNTAIPLGAIIFDSTGEPLMQFKEKWENIT